MRNYVHPVMSRNKVICSHCLSNEEVIDMKSAAFCYDSLITIDNWLVSILPSLNPTILISGFLDSWNYSYQFGETKTVVGDSSNTTNFFCIHTILHGMDISGLTHKCSFINDVMKNRLFYPPPLLSIFHARWLIFHA